jgi:Fur family transcriptional regulator, ferric uptake regulator
MLQKILYSDMDAILRRIRNDGFRLTRIRTAMVKILFDESRPLTSSDIQAQLSSSGVKADRTTVYRELLFLLERTIIKTVQFADHKMHYEICVDHHHHLVCTKCNKVIEIVLGEHLEEQEKEIYRRENFKVSSHSLEFYGLCGNCL